MSRRTRTEDFGGFEDVPYAVLDAYRYLCVKVALDCGTLHAVSGEDWPQTNELICIDWRTGRLYSASRPLGWGCAEEERQLSRMRTLLLEAVPTGD